MQDSTSQSGERRQRQAIQAEATQDVSVDQAVQEGEF